MRSSTLKFVLAISGYSAYSEKMSNPELVMGVIEKLGKLLGMSQNMLQPYCLKMNHNADPRRSFIMGGIIAHSRSVMLDTYPGKRLVQLHIFSTRGLKGFQKIAEKIIREAFDLSRYEMDIQKLENLR